jgi:hypothetical protein
MYGDSIVWERRSHKDSEPDAKTAFLPVIWL